MNDIRVWETLKLHDFFSSNEKEKIINMNIET